jgi:aryl-alcohol dehydrogenase-like predicted oxidoreductase
LVTSGRVRYLGCSNYAAWQLAHANLLAELKGWTKFAVIQSEYNMLNRKLEEEIIPYCRTYDVGLVPYLPLAGGFLTDKYKRDQPAPAGSRGESSPYVQGFMKPEVFDITEKLGAWAQAKGHALNELAQAWLMAQPKVCSVISGATKLEQVEANVKAADWVLTETDLKEISEILGK